MERRSPPLVNQKCQWRMFGIFNLREAHSDGRSVSNRNGKSRISSDVLSTVDEKYPDVDVCSRRRRGYSCKSVRVENDRVADLENEVTKMIVNQRFFNKNSKGKDGADCQPNQFLDAVQVLYSNKELFTKLLQDPNSLLVKQIHDIQKTQVKAEENGVTRLNKAQNSSSFDRFNSSSNCESQSSKKIVVLKHDTNNVKHFADTSTGNAQNIKSSNFAFGEIKRKLKHVMRVRRKEKQCRTADSAPSKFPCSSQDLEDCKNVKKLETFERNSPINVHVSSEKSLKVFKLKDSESSMRQEEVDSEQNKLTVKDQGVKVLSHKKHQMLLKALHRDGESCSYSSSSAQKIKDLPVATFSNELQVFGAADISVNKSLSADNLHAHYDIPRGTDGSLVQVDYDRFEEKQLEDLITSSLDPMNKSKDIISEVLQTFSLKCDEPMKSHLSNLLMDSSSTFDEVNGLTDQFFDSTIMHEYIIECFMELYQNSGFSPHFSSRNSNFQACVVKKVLVRQINELVNLHFFHHPSPITLQQLVERDLARRESWMNIHNDAEEIAMEVEKNVLETLVLEIVSEMNIS
ncbi:hypothetical protein MtrunA17_Chr8g0386941 [Medicago truncatula]|uniref:DUF3741 family protein n=1 Tax=Medicago truncatula TaxID=3880 RepID=A0A072TU63_MEDTR|nr:uncharacterized protein LOC25502052 isoform X2 [Medicago truncatula]KEH21069.1 DUF3741 family protein [Medicago truncatula]RHN43359.1 hypothetical protein MtrunA17_Chr8g0386941 [Medicago truncatula]